MIFLSNFLKRLYKDNKSICFMKLQYLNKKYDCLDLIVQNIINRGLDITAKESNDIIYKSLLVSI